MIETVDSEKLADLLEKKWASMSMPEPLRVLVQVNTSEEEGKFHFEMVSMPMISFHFLSFREERRVG